MGTIYLFTLALGLVSITNAQPQLGLGALNPCGPNQSFRLCGPLCPALCGNLRPICDVTICIPGCFCNPGYVRLIRNGPCVRICPVGPGVLGLG
ncbi:chymotrypsin-elastase inhibitor ixodidin-like [Diachasma alloeum]|uniref:chymotrypsin-elastase inhibitor ixodidin-like n=1 Tax=Diachasma alloeum TaxID=454923 RepID=UPI0010FB965D|nr:chymotrypsin-elastase inhibitor ixodidin-like [Diachasma alloeum]